jgi:PAS domain S-box-containing protein
MEEILIKNIRFTNRARFFLFFLFLIFSLFSKLIGTSLSWSVIEIFILFLPANFISEISAIKIWSKEKAPQVNSSYFAHQLIEILLLFEIGYLIHPLPFFLLAIFYIIFSYFTFNQRVYPRIISLILIIGYFSFGLLAHFQILNYYFPSPFFLSFSLTSVILICSVFFGEKISESSENILEILKGKTEELREKESQQFRREDEFRRSRTAWEREMEKRLKEILGLKENLDQEKQKEKELEEKIAEMKKFQESTINQEVRKKIKEMKDRNLTIIESFSDGILVLDEENKLFLINPQAELFFDIKAEELMDKPISELTEIPIFESLANFLEQKTEKIFRKELPLKKNLILQVTISPLMKEKEKIGTLVILHDITREKTVERIKTEFVSLSAHQLRTPLSAIKWTLRMLLDGDLGKLNKEQTDFLEKTYKSNERMITLINDLLNVTRIEEGRYIYQLLSYDLVEITQSVIDSYKGEIERKDINFEFKKPEKKLPKILVDEEKIKIAIENLLDNAVRYIFPGGKITISLELLENEIQFKIEDTGIGIPRDEQPRVFTKFFRGVNAIRMETEGSGLGLFVTKNIIEAHGGRIWFKSEEGKGSTFYFALPLKRGKIE